MVRAFGRELSSPLGLAAGLDKDGEAIDLWAALGFGFVEVGTVTPGAGQPGNTPPRLERIIEDQAIVNRMGFNNHGAEALASRMAEKKTSVVVGANIGKAKKTPLEAAVGDYEDCLNHVFVGADYVVINVSSPNTPGLRALQDVDVLRNLIGALQLRQAGLAEENGRPQKPLLLKISPDLDDESIDQIAALSLKMSVDGVIATNTTIDKARLSRAPQIEGGMSGRPLSDRALAVTRRLYQKLQGQCLVVGVGGIFCADDAYQRIRAGASLVQIYTGFIYEGPGVVRKIVDGLAVRLERDGYGSIGDAVGVDA